MSTTQLLSLIIALITIPPWIVFFAPLNYMPFYGYEYGYFIYEFCRYVLLAVFIIFSILLLISLFVDDKELGKEFEIPEGNPTKNAEEISNFSNAVATVVLFLVVSTGAYFSLFSSDDIESQAHKASSEELDRFVSNKQIQYAQLSKFNLTTPVWRPKFTTPTWRPNR